MKKIIVVAVIIGFVITVITGFINTTPSGLLGASWYGWPLAWRIVPVVQHPESQYNVTKFVADFIIWSVIAGIVLKIGSILKSG